MNEKPILFSGPMVRAILDGRKTMTRRVMKKQPDARCTAMIPHGLEWLQVWDDLYGQNAPRGDIAHRSKCPYGQPGDRLWVRETWRVYDVHEVDLGVYEDGYPLPVIPKTPPLSGFAVDYAADGGDGPDGKWRPSIHMPRWASRLTLEVTAVRVERLQEISEADARSEGCPVECPEGNAVDWFNWLWDGINAKRGYPWASNPWVWVVAFKLVENLA